MMRSKSRGRLAAGRQGPLCSASQNYVHLGGVTDWERRVIIFVSSDGRERAERGERRAYCSFIWEENPLKRSGIMQPAAQLRLKIYFHTPIKRLCGAASVRCKPPS